MAFVGTNVEPPASECMLLFDGEAREFVLERLHTSVQSLRNVRVSSMAQEHATARAKKRYELRVPSTARGMRGSDVAVGAACCCHAGHAA